MAALLLVPPLGAIGYRFLAEIGSATPAVLATIAAVVAINAPLEELLWRGVFVTFWRSDVVRGYVYPAIGFALWHVAPQMIHPGKPKPAVFVANSLALGLCWDGSRGGPDRFAGRRSRMSSPTGSGLRNALSFLPA